MSFKYIHTDIIIDSVHTERHMYYYYSGQPLYSHKAWICISETLKLKKWVLQILISLPHDGVKLNDISNN